MAGRGPARAPGEHIRLPANAAADVDAYFEYRAYDRIDSIDCLSYFTCRDIVDARFFYISGIVLSVTMMEEKFSVLKNMKSTRNKFCQW
jgi:hypothetical protein